MTEDTPVPLTPARRLYRVAHRLGVILAIPLLIASVWNAGDAGISWYQNQFGKELSNPFRMTINGTAVLVDGSYLALSAEEKEQTRAEIAEQLSELSKEAPWLLAPIVEDNTQKTPRFVDKRNDNVSTLFADLIPQPGGAETKITQISPRQAKIELDRRRANAFNDVMRSLTLSAVLAALAAALYATVRAIAWVIAGAFSH